MNTVILWSGSWGVHCPPEPDWAKRSQDIGHEEDLQRVPSFSIAADRVLPLRPAAHQAWTVASWLSSWIFAITERQMQYVKNNKYVHSVTSFSVKELIKIWLWASSCFRVCIIAKLHCIWSCISQWLLASYLLGQGLVHPSTAPVADIVYIV